MISVFKQLPITVRYKNTREELRLPYAIYYREQSDTIYADNIDYYKQKVYILEFYFNELNETLEEKIEHIFKLNNCVFSKSEDIEIEKNISMIRYEIRRFKNE